MNIGMEGDALHEVAANDEEPPAILRWLLRLRPSIALAAGLAGLAYLLFGVTAILLFKPSSIPFSHVLFFAELPAGFEATLQTGRLPFTAAFGEISIVAAFASLYGSIQIVTCIALMLPMQYSRPFAMQSTISGFFVAYLITLVFLGELALDHRIVVGAIRISWIFLIFALLERVKAAYPSRWNGAEHFPLLADGVFAFAAGLIIQQGLDDSYAAALSGILFVGTYFVVMVVADRHIRRGLIIKQMIQFGPDEEIEESDSKWEMARRVGRTHWQYFQRLLHTPFEDLEREYTDSVTPSRRLFAHFRIADADHKVAAWIALILIVWGFIMGVGIWIAANWWLWILGVGR